MIACGAVRFAPKSLACLRRYDLRTFAADLVAGVTVGLVALPLAMAFAISSGVAPAAGLYCAIVAGFLISALGGSRPRSAAPPEPSWWWSRESSPATGWTACSCAP